jgi:hypothetical protein
MHGQSVQDFGREGPASDPITEESMTCVPSQHIGPPWSFHAESGVFSKWIGFGKIPTGEAFGQACPRVVTA